MMNKKIIKQKQLGPAPIASFDHDVPDKVMIFMLFYMFISSHFLHI